jgi:hypothetical protein
MENGLKLLREPFPAHQISYLPKGGVKLAYVGHAALTDRLLDADPAWQWEPLTMNSNGLPTMDDMGGMWIKLTVCGVTRLGYGHAGSKTGGDAIKEVIGDALRNAAMRFGAALDLWHKGDLHGDEKTVTPVVTSISATGEAWKSLDEDTQRSLRALAVQVTACMPDANAALDVLAFAQLDNEAKAGLWHLLDSATRSGLKKAQQASEAPRAA